jgi:cell division protein FtsQ
LKKFKKILFIAFWSVLIVGLLVSMGFVNKQQNSLPCTKLDVKVDQDGDLYFLSVPDIKQLIYDRGDSIVGQPKSTVNIPEIEHALNSHADIAKAEVYVTINGEVKVEVKQRRPLIRVINMDGDSYYLDDEGKLMPLSDKYTAKVLIANGVIQEPYAKRYKYSIADIAKDSLMKATSMLDELYAMAKYINADEFWRSQVQQIYINSDKDMEIVPMVGDQKIIFGDTTSMDEKFKKLLTFYQQGLNTTGWWDKYSTINLKFKNQIVCTKKI